MVSNKVLIFVLIVPITPLYDAYHDGTSFFISDMELYAQLCYLAYMEQSVIPDRQLKKRLLELLINKPRTILKAMGFPDNWQSEPLWN